MSQEIRFLANPDVKFAEQEDFAIPSVNGKMFFRSTSPQTLSVHVIAASPGDFRDTVNLSFTRGQHAITIPVTISGIIYDRE